MSNVVDFATARRQRSKIAPNPRGTIEVYPCDVDGGSWAVDHTSASGDNSARIGIRFALEDAIRLARRTAAETNADFSNGVAL